MKYEIEIRLSDYQKITVFAENRKEAAFRAVALHPKYYVEAVTELQTNTEHLPIGRCESCQCFIFDDEDHASDEDGLLLCSRCKESALTEMSANTRDEGPRAPKDIADE